MDKKKCPIFNIQKKFCKKKIKNQPNHKFF